MVSEFTESSSAQPETAVDMESLLQEQEGYVARPGEIRKGRVIQVTEDGALVDVGLKREGFVPISDLRQVRKEMGEIHEGDEVFVKLLESESEGYIKASIYQARLEEDWIRAEEMMRSGALYEGRISSYNRGGLTVPFGRIRGFIPVSQVVGIPRGLKESERRQRLAAMVGQTVGLRVVDVNREEKRLILSQRRAHRAWQRILRKRLLDSLEVGQRRRGKVSSITDFGVFVDLGGVEGMVHVSELSWHRVEDPHQVVQVGDEVEVVVLEVNRRRERIALSIKQTQEDPWTRVGEKYRENQLVEGEVTRVTDIGAFVELEPGVEGLLHASELIGAPDVTPQQVLKPGETILVKVLEVNPSRRRIRLSARRVRRDEWERWAAEKAARERAAKPAPEAEMAVFEAEAEAPDEPATVPEVEPVALADEG
ncbi:MAG: S1 RNA-binding domain-containing protein [Thermoflexales bacterium]|nr:S1 RNA-binding domain-containing protein [Thermoflexales bacterium]